MKVLLTILGRNEAIKLDFPIIPDYDSKIYLSATDYQKLHESLKDQHAPFGIKVQKNELSKAADIMLENSTVQYIDIAWDEEEQAYLPLIGLSLGEDFFDDDYDDKYMDESSDLDEEKSHHKCHPQGKKRNLFN